MNDKTETETAAPTHAQELQKLGRRAVKAGIGTLRNLRSRRRRQRRHPRPTSPAADRQCRGAEGRPC